MQLVHGPEGLGEGSAVVGGVQVHDVHTGHLDTLLDNMLAYWLVVVPQLWIAICMFMFMQNDYYFLKQGLMVSQGLTDL